MKGDKLAKIGFWLSLMPLILMIFVSIFYLSTLISRSLGNLIFLLSFIFPITSIILSIIVLAKKMDGKGYAIAALILSIYDIISLLPFLGLSLGNFF